MAGAVAALGRLRLRLGYSLSSTSISATNSHTRHRLLDHAGAGGGSGGEVEAAAAEAAMMAAQPPLSPVEEGEPSPSSPFAAASFDDLVPSGSLLLSTWSRAWAIRIALHKWRFIGGCLCGSTWPRSKLALKALEGSGDLDGPSCRATLVTARLPLCLSAAAMCAAFRSTRRGRWRCSRR